MLGGLFILVFFFPANKSLSSTTLARFLARYMVSGLSACLAEMAVGRTARPPAALATQATGDGDRARETMGATLSVAAALGGRKMDGRKRDKGERGVDLSHPF